MHKAGQIIGIAGLVAAWGAMLFALTLLTELILVPWDAAITLPEPGSWQLALNDFFSRPPGNLLVGVPVLALSIFFTLRHIRRHPQTTLVLALMTWVFILSIFALFMLAAMLNNGLFPYPPVLYDPNFRGFHRSVVPGIITGAGCVLWLVILSRFGDFYTRRLLPTATYPASLAHR